jgi:hypothetical protein
MHTGKLLLFGPLIAIGAFVLAASGLGLLAVVVRLLTVLLSGAGA